MPIGYKPDNGAFHLTIHTYEHVINTSMNTWNFWWLNASMQLICKYDFYF